MTEAWDVFWIVLAWSGLMLGLVAAFVFVVWLVGKLIGPEPELPTMQPTEFKWERTYAPRGSEEDR